MGPAGLLFGGHRTVTHSLAAVVFVWVFSTVLAANAGRPIVPVTGSPTPAMNAMASMPHTATTPGNVCGRIRRSQLLDITVHDSSVARSAWATPARP